MKTLRHPRSERGQRGMLRHAAVALCLIALPVVGTWAQSAPTPRRSNLGTGVAQLTGLDELQGQDFATLRAKALPEDSIKQNHYSYDDRTRVFFLYNVATHKFLNIGGYWGVHASLKDYPIPVFTRAFSDDPQAVGLLMELSTSQANQLLWTNLDPYYQASVPTDAGVYADRGSNQTRSNDGYKGWYIEPVGATDDKGTVRICTYTHSGMKDGQHEGEKVYLSANIDNASTGGTTLDADQNCGAATEERLKERGLWNSDCLWRVFSLDQIYTLQDQARDHFTQPLDLSYKIECPGFDRGRTDRSYWKTYIFDTAEDGTATSRVGLQECNTLQHLAATQGTTSSLPSPAADTYTGGAFQKKGSTGSYTFPYSGDTPKEIKTQDEYLRYMAKYFCMDVTGAHGYIFQDQFVHHAGTYVIAAKGYSTTPQAKLFAGVVPTGTGKYDDLLGEQIFQDMRPGTLRTTTLAQTGYMDDSEQERLHIQEHNMDYAGKEFYTSYKYTNSVVVQVTQEMIDPVKGCRIRFGIMVGNPSEKGVSPSQDEWTVFDDFHLYYATKGEGDEDLVLDENRPDLSYLKDKTVYQNKTLHLAKTFTRNRWNSIVLPVSLTATQVRNAFGANTRLALLNKIEGTQIQFETVDLDQYQSAALQANRPYIIFPTRLMDDDSTPAYTATITRRNGTGDDLTYTVALQANHYDIAGVTLATDGSGDNDLSGMDDYYVSRDMVHTEGRELAAMGTFVRTFAPDATQNVDSTSTKYGQWDYKDTKGTIREGYDNLAGCYFFDQGRMYYSDKKVRGLRGFSCWFRPVPSTSMPAKPTVYIDGIGQEGLITQVGELVIGPQAVAQATPRRGVYNLMGQRLGDTLDGLPSGLYIVDGVKRMVK